jgi:tetratricopeptide (TPR) repeat protein
MNTILIATLLLQSLVLPPRTALENPAVVSPVPQKLRKDYDKLWMRFVGAKEDAKVVKDLDKLLKKQKDLTPAITLGAYIDLYGGSDSSAVPKFLQVLSVNPNDKIALYYLGELAFAGRDYAGAANFYSRLLALDGARADIEAKRQKAVLLSTESLLQTAALAEQEKRFGDAERLYRKALEVVGRNTEIEKKIAEALMSLGRTEEARGFLDRLRNDGTVDANFESTISELEDLGRWGPELALYRDIRSANSLTREQLAAIIVRYFPQVAEFPQSQQIVTDVQDSWARPEIQLTVGTGLIDPFPNHTFQPSSLIDRGLFALSMSRLIRLLGVSPAAASPIPTSDVDSSSAIYRDIQLVLSAGLMGLQDAGSFNVSGEVSGEEAVRAVEQLLRLSHGKAG